MNKIIYLSLALTAVMSINSAPLFAEETATPSAAMTPAEHKTEADLQTVISGQHKKNADRYRSMASVNARTGKHGLRRENEALAIKEDKIAEQAQSLAAEHNKLASPN